MKKNKITTLILIIVLLAGLSLLLYPSVADYWNSLHQTKAIADYTQTVDSLGDEDAERILHEAEEYNARLAEGSYSHYLSEEEEETYLNTLDISGTGVMGFVEIPGIEVMLPIYHGTDEAILQAGIGHLEWTSLPVGGTSSHCVLSGHRGLPSSKLLTNLDRMEVGDIFLLHVLDNVYCYEVDQILTVEPKDTRELRIVKGKDYCTLMTCTPYGVNSHRLLVRGHRIETPKDYYAVSNVSEGRLIEPLIVASVLAIAALIIIIIVVLIRGRMNKNKKTG